MHYPKATKITTIGVLPPHLKAVFNNPDPAQIPNMSGQLKHVVCYFALLSQFKESWYYVVCGITPALHLINLLNWHRAPSSGNSNTFHFDQKSGNKVV